jgi:hypothetical protein
MGWMQTTRDILVALARRYAFHELAYLIGAGALPGPIDRAARLQQLCAYGHRLFVLDAEDLASRNAAIGANTDTTFADASDELVPEHLVKRGERVRMRQSADEDTVDGLVSLYPIYRLLLEVVAIRWERRETGAVIAVAHIASEYAPLLAWQRYLGHAGNPIDVARDPAFAGPHSNWGDFDRKECPHIGSEKSAARRSLHVATEPPSGWRAYLDRQHSLVSHALGTCATVCRMPCSVMTTHTSTHRQHLTDACRAAAAFSDCALVRLRHAAPVGHGFGVPSPDEITQAWHRSRTSIARRGGLATAVLTEDDYPLAGLPSMFSAIAGTEITPDTLLADTSAEIVSELLD